MARRWLAQTARAAYRLLEHTPASALVPKDLVRSIRERLLTVDPDHVLSIIDTLDDAGVPACLAGGWGVDCLAARQTRPHADVDLIIPPGAAVLDHALRALATLDYTPSDDQGETGIWMPDRMVLRDPPGRAIDLISYDTDHLPVDQPVAHGTLEGRPVRCLSPEAQMQLHAGYDPRPVDRIDVALLSALYRIDPPIRYLAE